MSGAGVCNRRRVEALQEAMLSKNWILGSRCGVPDPTIVGPHEEQAQGCSDRPQFAQEEERGLDEALSRCEQYY